MKLKLAALWAAWSWIAASLLANGCIMAVEYINRGAAPGSPWWPTLLRTIPFIVVAQYGLFRSFSGATHWLMASMVFSLGNSVMRLAAVKTFAHGEVESWWLVTLGTLMMSGGAIVIKGGLK